MSTDVVLAAASDTTCPVPRVAGCDEASAGARVGADAVTGLRHVVRGYAAMADAHVDVVHDHTLAGPLYRPARHLGPVVTTAHGPFDANLGPLYRAMRDVAVVAISHHQASTALGAPVAAVIHHGLDVESVRTGRGNGGYASPSGGCARTRARGRDPVAVGRCSTARTVAEYVSLDESLLSTAASPRRVVRAEGVAAIGPGR